MGIVGERLRERRKAAGLNPRQLAERLSELMGKKISQQSVDQAERKEDSYPAFSAYLPAALGTSLKYLTGRTSDPKVNDFDPEVSENDIVGPKKLTREGQMSLGDLYFKMGMMEQRLKALETKGSRRGRSIKKARKVFQPGRRAS